MDQAIDGGRRKVVRETLMQRCLVAVGMLLLAGCDKELSPEEQALADARDVEMVKAANDAMPPLRMVTPEPILLPDIERYDLYGEACNYAPGTSFGTRVVAREADAFMKIDGEVHRFAADPGSRELPMHTRSLYNGKEYSVRLSIEEQGDTTDYEGSVTLRDRFGRV